MRYALRRSDFLQSSAVLAYVLTLGMYMVAAGLACAQVQVLTEHNDTFRSGANTNETRLTWANVKAAKFGKLFSLKVDGNIVGQPLYLTGVHFPNGSTHNVVYVATQHDSVYAFDADKNQAPLWTVSYINPAAGITSVPISAFGCAGTHFNEIGIMSTPVIDAVNGRLYLVAKTEENGAFIYRLHAVSITTGHDVMPPTLISASATTAKGTLQFNPAIQMQRPALLLSNGTVYIGFGSNGCDTFAYHGWLLAYNELTLQPAGTFITTPDGTKGAIWQSGGGPAADSDGTIFLAVANGTFDASSGGLDYGDSLLHLTPASGGLTVLDYFTPYNEQDLSDNDWDLGAGGVLLVPDQAGTNTREAVGGGKEGTLYLVDRDNLGGFNPASDSQIVQSIPNASAGELDNVPAYWNRLVYIAGENDFVKAFSLTNGVLSDQPASQTSIPFSVGGGGSVSVSSSSQLSNGILWAMTHSATASILYAFDATNLATELYDSHQAKLLRDNVGGVPHFATPTVANGRVYIGGNAALTVYGLLPVLSPVSGNHQSAFVGTTLALQVKVADAYQGSALSNVAVSCKDGGVGGIFSSASVITDSQGLASVNYTLPHKGKSITITCTNPTMTTATFSEVAVDGPPSRVTPISGGLQMGPVSTQLPAAFVAEVFDRFSFGVPGVMVTFSDGGAGGIFSSPTATTGTTGQVSTFYTTPSKTGTYVITATAAGLSPAEFTITVQ